MLWRAVRVREHPWLQFNPLTLMNANRRVFGVNLGHRGRCPSLGGRWVERRRTISDHLQLGASDDEGVNLWIGYGAIYVPGGQQT
jgi:hypothetical protein